MLSARRVNQDSVHVSVTIGLKRHPNGEFRHEKLPAAFRAEAEFRKSPPGWQLDCQEVVVPNDSEHSFTLRFISTRVDVKDRRINRNLSVLRDSRSF
jgi:hypothetical protein